MGSNGNGIPGRVICRCEDDKQHAITLREYISSQGQITILIEVEEWHYDCHGGGREGPLPISEIVHIVRNLTPTERAKIANRRCPDVR